MGKSLEYEIFISRKPQNGRNIREIGGIPVVCPHQIHGADVRFVGSVPYKPPIADALITDSRRIWIGVLTADCLPVFLVGNGVVGIVHAGWRGTLKGVTFNAVSFINRFSAVRKAIFGPCICENCYEVGEDVRRKFPREYRFCFREIGGGKYLFDLKEANKLQLRAAGVSVIEDLGLCCFCNNDEFYSYRKEKTDKRTLSAIRLL